jgi:hypothetical protein
MATPGDTNQSYNRIDLTKVQSTSRNSMKLFPLGKKSLQKVIIGDDTGTIQSFGIKKGYMSVSNIYTYIGYSIYLINNKGKFQNLTYE